MNEGQQRGQFYLTGDHNLTTEAHTQRHSCEGTSHTDKSDKISVSKSDRQAAYLYQTRAHC